VIDSSAPAKAGKPPQAVFNGIFAFPPNRATLGGTAYLIVEQGEHGQGNILIDAPPWNATTEAFLASQGGVAWFVITHRGSIEAAQPIQRALEPTLLIQEQEAYLLPNLTVTPFHHTHTLTPQTEVIWTPGHSPGSACVYHRAHGGILFTGRHLLPDPQGNPGPQKLATTFHWPRQLRQVDALRQRFDAQSLSYLCPGANTGFLRGQRSIDRAWERLQSIDLEALA